MPRLQIKTITTAILIGQLLLAGSTQAALNIGKEVSMCASSKDAKKVQKFYQTERGKGAPLPIPGRVLTMPELHVATGIAKEHRVGIAASGEIIQKLWRESIDSWGKNAGVRLVFTMGGAHVMDFPSLIPIAQENLDDGWIDIYADDGKGVHGHLWLDRVKYIHAIDLPGKDEVRTRTISFYDADGTLAMGLYASITTKKFDQQAVDGFEKTWDLLAAMPQICR